MSKNKSSIEWTDYTLSWVTGCKKFSSGCYNCYAALRTIRNRAMSIANVIKKLNDKFINLNISGDKKPYQIINNLINDFDDESYPEGQIQTIMAKHLSAEDYIDTMEHLENGKYWHGFNKVVVHDKLIDAPLKWKKPARCFVNSMSDTFHEDVPTAKILQFFKVMIATPHIQYQILTKRSERLLEIDRIIKDSRDLFWADNIWLGVTVEDQDAIDRVDHLLSTGAKVKFISAEPLIGPVKFSDVHLKGLDQIIVGGESVNGLKLDRLREMNDDWVRDIRDQCIDYDVSFFFKQYDQTKKKDGRMIDGREWSEFPVDLIEISNH